MSGADVYSPSGDKLGKIEDVALEKVGGEVAYAILSFGGFLGLGADYHPVPWRMLRYDVERRGYVIPCESDQLAEAPGIRREDLIGWDDSSVRDAIYAFYEPYGARPYWML
ncbi:PRC-barrel domain-containing protein [Phenylobacterium sp. J367]|uniref:PRC-barrel domain-containing protein n=1 Tax=Phenylobacterium sp. J367 TaxID=2898435 RepID=UPI002151A515|nr:PRC-barrel domain-containing protein [Phenylobacterium sp. J367]MCR5879647.1 PRC-barrel domain-containing protein [Phenylobacterium sp. J367]